MAMKYFLSHEESMDHKQRLQDVAEGVHLKEPAALEGFREAVLNRIKIGESRLASPNGNLEEYTGGVARYDNESRIALGRTGLWLCTEHATEHTRTSPSTGEKTIKDPETGVAGLASVLAADLSASHATLLGRQTADANNDTGHPFKKHVAEIARGIGCDTFVSLHGMLAGKVATLQDERSYDLVVGIGRAPSEKSRELGDMIVAAAAELGLKAGVNRPLLRIREEEGKYYVPLEDNHNLSTITFAAGPRTTRGYMEQSFRNLGQEIASLQIELSDPLRLLTAAVPRSSRVDDLGPYLGYATLANPLYLNSQISL
jgi:hypothetical protein